MSRPMFSESDYVIAGFRTDSWGSSCDKVCFLECKSERDRNHVQIEIWLQSHIEIHIVVTGKEEESRDSALIG